ncbi:mitochondrial ribosomal protein L1 isoform X1 [Megalopta genalis]|uniref:mitochondrial ribosomal protein L1 isoform X1 n=2 Tax=Megalopta genalis TaxID=115081 RepID=UPI003FD4C320
MYQTVIMSAGWLMNSFRSTYNHISGCNVNCLFMQTREYAARRGTRDKREALKKSRKKAIQNVQKVGYIPSGKEAKKKVILQSPLTLIDDSWKKKPVDNVWILKYHRKPFYAFKEAIECHRETNHPTMYNRPDAYVNAIFALNLQREKKTKFLEKLTNLVETPHPFDQQTNRTILAFCKKTSDIEDAMAAGANHAGGVEIIRQIQNGSFAYKEYSYIVAHVDILPDLLLIRGLLKLKFPHVKIGNLGTDMGNLVKKFKQGMVYKLQPNPHFKEFGTIDCAFGTLNMDIEHLKANFDALIKNIYSARPKRDAQFILSAEITSPPSTEIFKLQLDEFLPKQPVKQEAEEEEEGKENIEDAVIASQ